MMEFVNVSTGIFESIVAFILISSYTDVKTPVSGYKCWGFVVLLAVLINISNAMLNMGILNVVTMIFSIFAVFYTYSKQIKISGLLAVILILVLLVSEVVVMFSITFFANVSAEEATNAESFRILGIVLSKLLAFFIIKFVCIRHPSGNKVSMKGSYWLLFFTIFIISTLAIYLLFIYQYGSTTASVYDKLAVWCSIGLLYSTLFSLYLYENIARQAEIAREHDLYQQQIKAQTKHLDEIMITQNELKTLRHDMNNHNIAIMSFFENHECDKGIEYMQNLNTALLISDCGFDTGNTALDSILNTKKTIAESKGIEFRTDIRIPEKLFVDPMDICIIFGNALDNCIEACECINDRLKYINIYMVYDNESLVCKLINSAEKSKKGFLRTAKKDFRNHGLGIKSIQSSIQKYGGEGRFYQTDTEFILSFVMFKN